MSCNPKETHTLFVFHNHNHKRNWMQWKKIKLVFQRFFDCPLKILYFSKEFFACFGTLSYLPKLKRGLGLALGVHFPYTFPIKMCLI